MDIKSLASALIAALVLAAGAPTAMAESRALVHGTLDADLRERIERAVGESPKPAESGLQARRRAEDAAEAAMAALRSEGYYDAAVTPEVTQTDRPRAFITVAPGPRYRLSDPRIEWLKPPSEQTADAAASRGMDLKPGQPGRAAEVLAAEGRIVAVLARRGYADAQAGERRVVVDHAARTVRPTFRIDAGSLVRLDGISLISQGRTRPAFVTGLAPWRQGQRYDPDDVAELERRLVDTGVYETVTVGLAPVDKTDATGLRPVVVSLSDRARATLELGAGYSTSEGAGLDGRVTFYNRLGRADTLALYGRLAQIDQRLRLNLSLPHWSRPAQTLTLATEAFNEETDAYDRAGAQVRADLKRRFSATSFLSFGLGLEASRNREVEIVGKTRLVSPLERNLVVATGYGLLSLDRSNDLLDPRRGYRVSLDLQPTVVTGDLPITFVRVMGQASAYLPLTRGGTTVAAGRLRLGTILNGAMPETPADRRFYAGGGGSVRGYEYQGVGPRLANGRPEGGLSLIEGSLELRRDLFGAFQGAVFVDGGAVGAGSGFDVADAKLAVGLGARYRLPFGPIRADLAFPLDREKGQAPFQIYLSIGQAF